MQEYHKESKTSNEDIGHGNVATKDEDATFNLISVKPGPLSRKTKRKHSTENNEYQGKLNCSKDEMITKKPKTEVEQDEDTLIIQIDIKEEVLQSGDDGSQGPKIVNTYTLEGDHDESVNEPLSTSVNHIDSTNASNVVGDDNDGTSSKPQNYTPAKPQNDTTVDHMEGDHDESVNEPLSTSVNHMDTSAGLTPFKKQKGDKKQKENGAASAKKDKPTVQCTLDPDHVTSRVRPCNLSLRILPSKVASDTPFLSCLWTK